MGTTTNYAFRYPAASDAADGPTQIQNLATDLDTRRYTDRQTAAFLRQTSAQTLTTADTTYMISFNAEDHDNGGGHDNSTNNSRWTVPAGRGGTYAIQGGWGTATGAAHITAAIAKNGAVISGSSNRTYMNTNTTHAVSSRLVIVVLVATDYIELAATSDLASTVTTTSGPQQATLSLYRLSD